LDLPHDPFVILGHLFPTGSQEPVGDRPTKMTKRTAGQIQGGGMRQIAALFGHSDNAGDAQRDRVSFAGLSPTGS